MSLVKSAGIVGSLTLISRALGYVRDVCFAIFLGATSVADSFFVAYRLPNLFRQISAEGAFNNAFVPLFSKKLTNESEKDAMEFAINVGSFMLWCLTIFTIAVVVAMPWVMHLLAPGFVDQPEQFDQVVLLGRIMFPYLIFISLVSWVGGILNSHGKFWVFAAAPILLNITLISCLLLFQEKISTSPEIVGGAVIVAGLIQFLWMYVHAKMMGVNIIFRRYQSGSELTLLLKRMVPGVIGGSAMQLNVWINTLIATLIPGAVSYLYYADRLVQFPLAIIGTAMGVVLLPTLSKKVAQHDINGAKGLIDSAVQATMVLIIPATIGLVVIADAIIRTVFEHGAFTAQMSEPTIEAMVIYSFGLPAFVLIKIFATPFFASGDTKTPVKIALTCLVVGVAVSVSLLSTLEHLALALSTVISSWLNASILVFLLFKKNMYALNRTLVMLLTKLVVASVVMGGCVLWVQHIGWLTYRPEETLTTNIMALVGIIILAIVIYVGVVVIGRIYPLGQIKSALLNKS